MVITIATVLVALLQGSLPATRTIDSSASSGGVRWTTSLSAWPYRQDEQAQACLAQNGPMNVFIFKDGTARILFGPTREGQTSWAFADSDVAALTMDGVRYEAKYVLPWREADTSAPQGATVSNDKGFIELISPSGVALPISSFLSAMASSAKLTIWLRSDTGLEGPASYSVDLTRLGKALGDCRTVAVPESGG